MTEEEMVENSKLWAEENSNESVTSGMPNMRSVGVTSGGIDTDLENFDVDAGNADGVDVETPADATGVESPTPGEPPASPA
jgi:hypothetical protein